ncbi:MAG: putative periplasmic solute-binding protein, partial [Acidimicrobiales bacterium]|nr:putative periplasmic solute-binding protein [Acidimicrobiales bacterium]
AAGAGPRRPRASSAGTSATAVTAAEGDPPVDAPVARPIAGPAVDDGHEYVDLPDEGSIPRWVGVLLVLLILVGMVFGGAWWWWGRQLDPPGSPGETVSVEVPRGSSTSGIGSILEDAGVVPNSWAFAFHLGRKQVGPFEAGVYRLRKNSDVDTVAATMAEGPVASAGPQVVKVSIPEGLTIAELIDRVAKQVPRFSAEKLQAALLDGSVRSSLQPSGQASYEGLLFPATYQVGADTTEAEFLDQLAAEMTTRVSGLDLEGAKARIKETYGIEVSDYDLLVVASMVQAEAGNADEAPKIATVIYNRLSQEMPLGIDAADNYGATLAGKPVDYDDAGLPYNTRRKQGLPPTPISAPGEFALSAALDPAVGPWLYYVLTDPHVHTFVETPAEFNQAKQICIQKGLGCG